jgi:hypothetical protein
MNRLPPIPEGPLYKVGWVLDGYDPVFMFFGLPHATAIAVKEHFERKFCPVPFREIVIEPDDTTRPDEL